MDTGEVALMEVYFCIVLSLILYTPERKKELYSKSHVLKYGRNMDFEKFL